MTYVAPTGQTEGQRLEFKAGEVLGSPRDIAREVTAMLNAGGGRIWIGVPEANDVALPPTPIEDAEERRLALLDQLLDLITPAPAAEELTIRLAPVGEGAVLVVDVGSPCAGRAPFAWKSNGLLGFARRMDHRVVPMSLAEIRQAMRSEGSVEARSEALRWIESELDERAPNDRAVFVLTPEHAGVALEEIDDAQRAQWQRLIESPPPDLSRFIGRRFVGSLRAIARRTDLEACEREGPAARSIRVDRSGRVVYSVPTKVLTFEDPEPIVPGRPTTMHPYLVMSWLRAACHVASWAMKELRGLDDGLVLSDIRVRGTAGIAWVPYSPRSAEWTFWRSKLQAAELGDDVRLRSVVSTAAPRLREAPDALAITLLERLYEAVGFETSHVPYEADLKTRAFLEE